MGIDVVIFIHKDDLKKVDIDDLIELLRINGRGWHLIEELIDDSIWEPIKSDELVEYIVEYWKEKSRKRIKLKDYYEIREYIFYENLRETLYDICKNYRLYYVPDSNISFMEKLEKEGWIKLSRIEDEIEKVLERINSIS